MEFRSLQRFSYNWGIGTLYVVADNTADLVRVNPRLIDPLCEAFATPAETIALADALADGETGAVLLEMDLTSGDYARVGSEFLGGWVRHLYTSNGPGNAAAQVNPYFCRIGFLPDGQGGPDADQVIGMLDDAAAFAGS